MVLSSSLQSKGHFGFAKAAKELEERVNLLQQEVEDLRCIILAGDEVQKKQRERINQLEQVRYKLNSITYSVEAAMKLVEGE